jgi:DNA repair protein SbcD/Mre11
VGDPVRILLLADSHLGFDLPTRARVKRRRRGHDFLANYERALAPALAGEVDVVVHAGDVFDRSSVVESLAYQAFEPLRRIAASGIPVLVVPGNHERSRLPHLRFAKQANLHIFAAPGTYVLDVRGTRTAFSGFPYERHNVRGRFSELLSATRWVESEADARILCVHHCVEGATVGPVNYTFTTATDVIRLGDVPGDFAAVLSGHIHRHQVLTTDLAGRHLATPVLYPGSIERTALAEIGEPKGFMIVEVGAQAAGPRLTWSFRELPARPMIRRELDATGLGGAEVGQAIEAMIAAAPPDAVLSILLAGRIDETHAWAFSTARLRELAPGMNIEIVSAEPFADRRRGLPGPARPLLADAQLSLL